MHFAGKSLNNKICFNEYELNLLKNCIWELKRNNMQFQKIYPYKLFTKKIL